MIGALDVHSPKKARSCTEMRGSTMFIIINIAILLYLQFLMLLLCTLLMSSRIYLAEYKYIIVGISSITALEIIHISLTLIYLANTMAKGIYWGCYGYWFFIIARAVLWTMLVHMTRDRHIGFAIEVDMPLFFSFTEMLAALLARRLGQQVNQEQQSRDNLMSL